jgi:hypothetical protein
MDAYNRAWNYLVRKCGYKIIGPTESLRKEAVNVRNKKEQQKLLQDNFPHKFLIIPENVTEPDDLKILQLMKDINIVGGCALRRELANFLDHLEVPHEFKKLSAPEILRCS